MHLGIDFDNTIISYDELFWKVAVDKTLIPKEIKAEKNAVRDYLRSINRENEWTLLQGDIYGKFILDAPPYPNMLNSLRALSRIKIPLTIISHKTKAPIKGEQFNLHGAAKEWMKKNGIHGSPGAAIQNDHVFFELSKEEKCNRIIKEGCTHFIDDLPDVLNMLPKNIIKVYFDPHGHFLNDNQFIKMKCWGELQTLLSLN